MSDVDDFKNRRPVQLAPLSRDFFKILIHSSLRDGWFLRSSTSRSETVSVIVTLTASHELPIGSNRTVRRRSTQKSACSVRAYLSLQTLVAVDTGTASHVHTEQ